MNEEELAALNAQIKALLDLQADAALVAKAKFAGLDGPVCYTQATTRTRTTDGHHSTIRRSRIAASLDEDTYTHQCLGASRRRGGERLDDNTRPSLYRRLLEYLFPRARRRHTIVNPSEFR